MLNIRLRRWFIVGIGVKRWLILLILGVILSASGLSLGLLKLLSNYAAEDAIISLSWLIPLGLLMGGLAIVIGAFIRLSHNILAPYRIHQRGDVIDVLEDHSRRHKGFKYVAIGGGTGLPASLRGIKQYTSNITAIVTVADDGGSSGRLRRDMGVLPPGDLRNNIAALAEEDSLLTKLFQYRFENGDLEGHAFGNLFIAALANIVSQERDEQNSLAEALTEVERVLNIHGKVLPATLRDVYLTASMRLKDSDRHIKVKGESQFEQVNGTIERIQIFPPEVEAYPASVQAILNADVIVIGPGSLYTSILPNLMVKGIGDALRATRAHIIYVCNVATQPVETEDYDVADHVMALERHIGRGVFQTVLANDNFPQANAGITQYVRATPENHEIRQRYEVRYTDLCDSQRPWRHDPLKLARAILAASEQRASGHIPSIKNAS